MNLLDESFLRSLIIRIQNIQTHLDQLEPNSSFEPKKKELCLDLTKLEQKIQITLPSDGELSSVINSPLTKTVVLIDDDYIIGTDWLYLGKLNGVRVKHYICYHDFHQDYLSHQESLPDNTPLYVDWFLSSQSGSADVIQSLATLGFKNIHITTAAPAYLPKGIQNLIPGIEISVMGKSPPWE